LAVGIPKDFGVFRVELKSYYSNEYRVFFRKFELNHEFSKRYALLCDKQLRIMSTCRKAHRVMP